MDHITLGVAISALVLYITALVILLIPVVGAIVWFAIGKKTFAQPNQFRGQF